LLGSLTSLSDSYLEVPILHTTNSANWICNFAPKVSAAEIFESIHVQIASGDTIIQEASVLPFINSIRRRLRMNRLGVEQYGSEFNYVPDKFSLLPVRSNDVFYQPLLASGINQNICKADLPISLIIASVNTDASKYTVTLAGGYNTAGLFPGQSFTFQASTQSAGTALLEHPFYIWTVDSLTTFTFTNTKFGGDGDRVNGVNCTFTGTPSVLFTENTSMNEGFEKRITQRILNTQQVNGTSFIVNYIVPLRELHDLFRQWVSPIVNFGIRISLTLAQPFSGSSAPFCAILQDPLTDTAGYPSLGTAVFTPTQAKWWLKSCKLEPSDAQKMEALMRRGFTKNLQFHETLMTPLFTNHSQSGTIPATITNSVTHLKRLIFFGLPAGAAASKTLTINPTIRFNSVSLKINNQPFNPYPISSMHDHYRSLKEQCHGGGLSDTNGSLISWEEYQKGYLFYYVFNFERPGLRPDFKTPISIQVDFQRAEASPVPADIYVLMEREANMEYSIDTNMARMRKYYA
jgi:hypothetical protein